MLAPVSFRSPVGVVVKGTGTLDRFRRLVSMIRGPLAISLGRLRGAFSAW